jgi:XTP/dITP diphosphohydrolase
MEKVKIVVATNNANKLREIAQIFPEYEVLSQAQVGFHAEVEETGTTFAENALIKARAACEALGMPVLADDSGLCVDALGGAPGVYSARYSGEHGNDQSNRDTLLKNMEGIEDRTAYFCSAIAMVFPDGKELLAEGKTYGKILTEEQGNGGFGYDPIFFSDDVKKSFGVATAEEKNSVSHRYRALCKLREMANF